MAELDDPEKLKRKATVDTLRRRQELQDVAFVLSTEQGRRFYWRLMRSCGINRSSFTGNNTTFFNEGERNVGLRMLSDLEESDPTAYLKCLEESRKLEQSQK